MDRVDRHLLPDRNRSAAADTIKECMEYLELVPKLEHSRRLPGRVMVVMVVMALVSEAVLKLGHSRRPLDRVTVVMVLVASEAVLKLELNQLLPDKAMAAMAMVELAVPKPDPNHTARDNPPLDLVVNGQNIPSRVTGSVYE